jgi:predicted enzyme related to lactoylglutathione lyase
MTENRSAPPGPVVPMLAYDNVDKAIEWLSEAFGFTERLRTPPEPDGNIHHAQLTIGAGAVILVGQRNSSLGLAQKARLFVPVNHVNTHLERATKHGAKIVNAPRDCEFGERQYTVEDPVGHQWTFSQSLANVEPENWGAKVAKIEAPRALLPRPRFCYIEMPARDVQVSAAFYEKTFGWNIRNRETRRPSFDDACGVISGAWVTGREPASEGGLLPYIWVDDLRASVKKVSECGGIVVDAPHPDHPGGTSWIATFRDPAGNLLGLYQENVAK